MISNKRILLATRSTLHAIATVEHSTEVDVEHVNQTDHENEPRQARRQRERLEKKERTK